MEVLGRKYPDLKNWVSNRWISSAGHACGRAASLDFGANLQVSINDFQEAASLARYFATPSLRASPPEPRRRLFLLEGADDGLRRVFTRELDIDPQVWARHDWVPTVDSRWDPTQSIGTKLPLPSLADPNETFFVDYLQMMYLNLETQDFSLRCTENGRRISSSRVDGKFDNVGAIGRRVSFWGRRCGGGGWDALLILDQPFATAVLRRSSHDTVSKSVGSPEPFQGGYADFIKYDSICEAINSGAPPRSSMFDDLLYYHTTHVKYLMLTKDPKSVTGFAQKIICSEYMMILHYHRQLLARLATKLSSRERFDVFDGAWIAEAWSDFSSFQRRLDTVHRVISRAMDRMGILKSIGEIRQEGRNDQLAWMETAQDFSYIQAELLASRQKADRLLVAFDSLASIVGSRQSLNEARSVGTLTRLGMVFLPLSLVAGLFSMSDHHQPGRDKFWLYFAVSAPSVLLTFGVAWLFTQGPRLVSGLVSEVTRIFARGEAMPRERVDRRDNWV